jgi:hypothetical protein
MQWYVCSVSTLLSTSRKLRHGPLSWWVMMDSKSHASEDAPFIAALPGMCNGGRVMLEMRNTAGDWPSERMIEDEEFRLFEVSGILIVCDVLESIVFADW